MNRQQRGPFQYPRAQQLPTNKGSKMDRFSTSLDTFQQVLGVIQSTAPYIEKYGPIVQKLPTIYRIYRAMKDIDDPVEGPEQEDENTTEPSNNDISTNNERQIGAYPLPTMFI